MDLIEEKFKKHFATLYHKNEIDALWKDCKEIFSVENRPEKDQYLKILGAKTLLFEGGKSVRLRINCKNIMKEFEFDPKKVEYWISYSPEKKTIILKCNDSRI